MASHFRADQFEAEFKPPKLRNWQVPKWHPSKPRQRTHNTAIISNDRGHLLPGIPRPLSNPWGDFKSTWQMPDHISRHQAAQLSAPHPRESRWAKPPKHRRSTDSKPDELDAPADDAKSYLPGDLTEPSQQHFESRALLERQRKSPQKGRPDTPDPLLVQAHQCDFSDGCPLPIDKRHDRPVVERPTQQPTIEEIMRRDVSPKPGAGEWDPQPPMWPASWNFDAARRMAVENLEHQPLPDAIQDRAFRRVQAQGVPNPELALAVTPQATGVGVKTHMAGPTQCTKLRIYRPKTCGVVPKAFDRDRYERELQARPHTCQSHGQSAAAAKLGQMDLAIQWDCRPAHEPQRAAHIDGSDASPGPAIFTVVKTPRTPTALDSEAPARPAAGGVFATVGENATDFFDADLLRRAAKFGSSGQIGRRMLEQKASAAERSCRCAGSAQQAERFKREHYTEEALARLDKHQSRNSALSQQSLASRGLRQRRCRSSPNLSKIVNVGSELGEHHQHHHHHHHHQQQHGKSAHRTHRLCDDQQVANQPALKAQAPNKKPPFKMGTPNSNAAGTCTSFDSGCGSTAGSSSGGASSFCSRSTASMASTVHVPKLRQPYAKRDYSIETLSPPLACWRGGAGQGGYPEHWRLASVYQHAFKPIEQRRRPLLATVYQ